MVEICCINCDIFCEQASRPSTECILSRVHQKKTFVLQGSRDNMSIIIVAFGAAPAPSEAAKQKEADLDSRIEAKVKGLL